MHLSSSVRALTLGERRRNFTATEEELIISLRMNYLHFIAHIPLNELSLRLLLSLPDSAEWLVANISEPRRQRHSIMRRGDKNSGKLS